MGHAWASQGSNRVSALFAKEMEKDRGGREIAVNAGIADIARDRKEQPYNQSTRIAPI
jgi:hypothetical protein